MQEYTIRLPLLFSAIIMHDGVPEIGNILSQCRKWVDWKFNDREVYALLDDAKWVQTLKRLSFNEEVFKYDTTVREAAHNSVVRLENLINAHNISRPLY